MIELQNVGKEFQRGSALPVTALHGVDLGIERGELVAIRGASGSGKSTLLGILGCLEAPTRGVYRLDGHDVAAAGDRRRARLRARGIGFVFQAFHLLPRTTALENVEMPGLYWPASRGRAEIRRRALAALERVGLGHRLRHYAHELSGGEQQRVAVARALINDPALILADEPTGNLDAASGAEVIRLLLELHGEGRTVVLVTHDSTVSALAPRQIVLRDGRVAAGVDGRGAPLGSAERPAYAQPAGGPREPRPAGAAPLCLPGAGRPTECRGLFAPTLPTVQTARPSREETT